MFHADPDCALHLNRPGPWHEHPPIGFYVCAHSLCHIQGVVVEDCAIDMDLLLHSLLILKFFDRLVPYTSFGLSFYNPIGLPRLSQLYILSTP